MKGFIGILALAYLFHYADAQITAWTITTGTVAGTNGAIVSGSVTAAISETIAAGGTLFTAAATGVATIGSPYAITTGNTGDVMAISSTGVVTLATGKSLDFETTPKYTLTITALASSGGTTGTLTLTVNIKNVLEFGQKQYGVCMSDGATADTTVGTYTVSDKTSGTTLTYDIDSGDTNDYFTISSAGVLKVATGKTLAQKTTGGYELTLSVTESGSVAGDGFTTVWIAVGTCGSSAVHVAATMGVTLLALVASVFA
ncbi:protocadherin Fat 2-like [Dreissena polymorpha]|nr:protocadherin Fat 2-like [Dreissena polymorpha]